MPQPGFEQSDQQRSLIHALMDRHRLAGASRGVRLVETHISWVLLAGKYAYKIKKAVNLGFLDFTSLAARKHGCEEEILLNRRLAPDVYLDVIPIGGTPDRPEPGGRPAIEYAVRMRRFAESAQFDRMLTRGRLQPEHLDRLAAALAAFHGRLPAAPTGSGYGTLAAIRAAADQNFEQLHRLLTDPADITMLSGLHQASEMECAANKNIFVQRLSRGCIRECHGDLHLGNVALVRQQPVPFDGIEFAPALRWIDVISEIAFTVMDLLYRQRPDLAFHFLNTYLAATGDYDGVAVLRFYVAYRAVVRAKVSAIRASQPGVSKHTANRARADCRSLLALAAGVLKQRNPALVIMHGLPGSGKSLFAQAAQGEMHAICIRSDVERKRLFGLPPMADSRTQGGFDIYTVSATRRTYARLHDLADSLLRAGWPVIVDAAFVRRAERARFRRLAHERAVPFVIVTVKARIALLRERILQRLKRADDPSEADVSVLERVRRNHEKLTPQERSHEVVFENS